MKWVKFAWKNLWRNRRRAGITIGITSVCAAGLLVFGGFMLFTFDSLAEMASRSSGHLVISHPEYFAKDEPAPMAFGLGSWEKMRAGLLGDDRVKYALPRINFTGLVSNGEKSVIYMGSGVDAEREFIVHGPFLDIKEGGELTRSADGMPKVMLGADMARDLNARVGNVLTILSTTSAGALNGMDFQVAGTYSTGTPELDKRSLMVDLPAAQELIATDKVSTMSIYLRDINDTGEASIVFGSMWPGQKITHWSELAFFYHKVRGLYSRIFGVFGIIILIVSLMSVANTVSMTVMERTREIGSMRAMGAYPGEILSNFALESALTGLIGSAAGMAIAGVVTVWLAYAGIMMPPAPGMNRGYPLIISFSWEMYLVVGAVMTVVTVIGGALAARRGVKISVVEALAHV
ncbi:MAG: ABC transporter permease [Nitrospinae bacterium]|nr:ABC transporter permease [Nitrospinota bacterium]